ncbi:hypothetical protein QBC34DRAFT_173914 [Podospora aff. communis PSN243]|uniref:Uncharacterized protein n=1 Tax=Podospora aff. communis PSN243 TaxID=3040156 RepID=A0AAV9H340_9PEZI|nr:hypothetical protein QBC34DRAFT_173914 [Podospora aff. communis PSN243]
MADTQSKAPSQNNNPSASFPILDRPPTVSRHPATKPPAAITNTTPATPAVLKANTAKAKITKANTKPAVKSKNDGAALIRNLRLALENNSVPTLADPNPTPTPELPKLFDLDAQRLLFRSAGQFSDKKKVERAEEVERVFSGWKRMSKGRKYAYYNNEEWRPWEEKWEGAWEEFERARIRMGVDVFGNGDRVWEMREELMMGMEEMLGVEMGEWLGEFEGQEAVFGENWTLETRAHGHAKPAEQRPLEKGKHMAKYHSDLRQQLAGRLAGLKGRSLTP